MKRKKGGKYPQYTYNYSAKKDGTFPIGKLIPADRFEVLPGDLVELNTSAFLRLAPMVCPSFMTLECNISHYFVPFRIMWDQFDEFILGKAVELPQFNFKGSKFASDEEVTIDWVPAGDVHGSTISLVASRSLVQEFSKASGTLIDYMGDPIRAGGQVKIKVGNSPVSQFSDNCYIDYETFALQYIAYWMIWNDKYRNPDLQDEAKFDVGGADLALGDPRKIKNGVDLLPVQWSRDQFIGALPYTQVGSPVSIPMTVFADGTLRFTDTNGKGVVNMYSANDGQGSVKVTPNSTSPFQGNGTMVGTDLPLVYSAGLKNTGLSVEELRVAMATQKLQEELAYYGNDDIRDWFDRYGMPYQDGRFQKPEFIGGDTFTFDLGEVVGTGDESLAKLGGKGVGAKGGKRFRFRAPEHGLIMTCVHFRPRTNLQNGMDRLSMKKTYLDMYEKLFENIGMEEIRKGEINTWIKGMPDITPSYQPSKKTYQTTDDDLQEVFAYQNRYQDYRVRSDRVVGEMRNTLDVWTASRSFAFNYDPTFNADFIECNPQMRMMVDQKSDPILGRFVHNVKKTTMVTPNPVPKLIG